MQKVYLLLRDNQRTGPYSLEELLALQLKQFDLVWVEGRSAGWRYPEEIDSLKTYFGETPKPAIPFEPLPISAPEQNSTESNIPVQSYTPASKKVFVSMPGKPRPAYTYQAPEEIASPSSLESFSPIPKYAPGYQEPVTATNNRTFNEPEYQSRTSNDDHSSQYLPKKTKKPFLTSRSLAMLALLVIICSAGYYFLSAQKTNTPTQSIVRQSVEQPDNVNSELATVSMAEENKTTSSNSGKQGKKEKLKQVVETKNKKSIESKTVILPEIEHTINTESSEPTTIEVNSKKEETISGPATESAPKEKKKKLGEAIKDIFKPKQKAKQEEKVETVMEEPKPANNRQSTKRVDDKVETKTNSETNIDWAGMVDITSNAPDNWMMGVKGLKLTLRNRSNISIQTASVELLYYNDNNQVLEKKLIYFSNIAAKGKLTVAAPDHKYADHVEFKLVTVTGKEDRFANNN